MITITKIFIFVINLIVYKMHIKDLQNIPIKYFQLFYKKSIYIDQYIFYFLFNIKLIQEIENECMFYLIGKIYMHIIL